MPVGGHSFWWASSDQEGLSEEALCRVHVTSFAQHRVDQIAVAVNRPVQIAPRTVDLHIGFIHRVRDARLAVPLGAQLIGEQWSKSSFPLPHRFVRKDETAFQKHLGQITEAELVAQPPQDDLHNDVGGECEIVEGRSGTFIKGTMARQTAEGTIAELGSSRTFTGCGRSAIGAGHQSSSRWQHYLHKHIREGLPLPVVHSLLTEPRKKAVALSYDSRVRYYEIPVSCRLIDRA
jgi:hypothetical protein